MHALRGNHLGGAGIDVLGEEPPRHGSPLLLHKLPNLIVTPHIAWASREARQRLVDQVVENIRAFQAGQPRNRVS
jgi:glycerate dehydrogenase